MIFEPTPSAETANGGGAGVVAKIIA